MLNKDNFQTLLLGCFAISAGCAIFAEKSIFWNISAMIFGVAFGTTIIYDSMNRPK